MRLVTGDDGKNGYLSHTRARSGAWRMILGTSVASSKGTGMMATLLMGLAARFHCRAVPPTPRLGHITLSGRSCSCWIVLWQSRNSTAHGSHVRSDLRDSHIHRRPPRRRTLTKKGHSYEPQISSVSLAIPTI